MKKWRLKQKIDALESIAKDREEAYMKLQTSRDWIAKNYKYQGEQAAQAKKELNEDIDKLQEQVAHLDQVVKAKEQIIAGHYESYKAKDAEVEAKDKEIVLLKAVIADVRIQQHLLNWPQAQNATAQRTEVGGAWANKNK